jgi:hypothetical protein
MTVHREQKKHLLETIAHVFAGVIILIKGFTASEHHPTLAVWLYVFGGLFVLIALSHHRIPALDSEGVQRVLFLLEGVVLLAVSYEMVLEHKHYLQYAYGLAALVYFTLTLIFPRLHARKATQA